MRVFTKEELLRDVWGFQLMGSTRTLDSHASRVRRKLSPAGGGRRWIVNVWGVGYRLTDRDDYARDRGSACFGGRGRCSARRASGAAAWSIACGASQCSHELRGALAAIGARAVAARAAGAASDGSRVEALRAQHDRALLVGRDLEAARGAMPAGPSALELVDLQDVARESSRLGVSLPRRRRVALDWRAGAATSRGGRCASHRRSTT